MVFWNWQMDLRSPSLIAAKILYITGKLSVSAKKEIEMLAIAQEIDRIFGAFQNPSGYSN
jgi:hypothetical protein